MSLSFLISKYHCRPLFPRYSRTLFQTYHPLKITHTTPTQITKKKITDSLKTDGYVFFRGAGITTSEKFKTLETQIFERDGYDYAKFGGIYTDTRKNRVDGVYEFVNVSTPFWDMPPHNDLSYRPIMCARVAIAQFRPAEEGGCTPLYDMRLIWVDLMEKFTNLMTDLHRYGLIYYKTLPDTGNQEKCKLWKSADVPSWQDHYPGKTKEEVQTTLETAGETGEWLQDGSLRVSWRLPAYRDHPVTGERFFCNQLLGFEARNYHQWPGKSFEKFPFLECPTHVRVGNGRDLLDEEYDGILDVHKKYAIRTPWEEGDVVVIDNIRMTHGRDPYKGERHLAIMWGDVVK